MSEETQAVQAPKKKKKHRFRNFFLIVVALIVAIAIGSSLGGGDDDEPEPSAGTNGEPSGPGLNDEAKDGDFTFVVTSIADGPALIGTADFGVKPQGKFVLVEMSVTNHGDSPGSFFGDNQFLIDTLDRKAGADTEAAIYMDNAESLFSEINPGNTLTGTVIFDIPADAVPASLELHDSAFSGGVKVALS